MKKNLPYMLGFLIMIFTLIVLVHNSQATTINDLVVKNAESFLYVREARNDNRSPDIDTWHKYHGLGFGNPYCQMFANYMYYLSFNEINKKTPYPKIARCSSFANWCLKNPLTVRTVTVKQILLGAKVNPGMILNWKHGLGSSPGNFTYNGHAGLVYNQIDKNSLITIEGNTKPSNQGDQTGRVKGDTKYGNDGVYKRTRGLGVGTNFQILFAFELINNKV